MIGGLIAILKELVQLARVAVSTQDPEDDSHLSAYEWLIREMESGTSTRVQLVPNRKLEPGKIYIFKYNAKTKDTLEYWDMHPVMLFIGTIKVGKHLLDMGVNITWWPPKFRKLLVSRIRALYRSQYEAAISKAPMSALEQRRVKLDIYALRYAFDHLGFTFAIRHYYRQRMSQEVYVVDYESWDRVSDLNVPKVFPMLKGELKLSEIYKRHLDFIQKVNKDRNGHMKRIQERRQQRYYAFMSQ
jgi:hypothetical protein